MKIRTIQRNILRRRYHDWRERWRNRPGHGTPGGKHPGRGRQQILAMSEAKAACASHLIEPVKKPIDHTPYKPLARRVRDAIRAPFNLFRSAAG